MSEQTQKPASELTPATLMGDDIDIMALEEAIERSSKGHPERPKQLSALGQLLQKRFNQLQNPADIDRAISALEEAIELTPEGHPVRLRYLANFGNSLHRRFKRLGDVADINRAILSMEEAVRLTPEGHPSRSRLLSNFGNSLQRRFQRLGNIADIDRAILTLEEAVELTPECHRSRPGHLTNFGNSLQTRFMRLGNISDIDRAISALEDVVELTSESHPDRPLYLSNFGNSLQRRFMRLGNIADINRAITIEEEAARLTPVSHPSRPGRLSKFGISLQTRFGRLGDIADIHRAISIKEEAIELTTESHPDRPGRLASLGDSLKTKFKHLGNIADIDRAISTAEEAVKLTAEDHPDRPMYFSTLGNSLQTRFERLWNIADIDRAISIIEEAVKLTPEDHPNRPARLSNLGTSLRRRFDRTNSAQDHEDAKTRFVDALQQNNGPPLVRIRAGRSAGLLYAESFEWIQASAMFATAVKLLPRISARSLTRDDLQYALTNLSGLSALAASAALQAKKPASEALVCLESGRGVMSSLAIDTRTDLSDLENISPLFREYSALTQQLSSSHSPMGNHTEIPPNTMTVGGRDTVSAIISKQNRLVKQLEEVEDRIRAEVPGYQNFQRSPPPSYFTELANDGPLVAFNITKFRSDAFIVTEKEIRAILLPALDAITLKSNVDLLIGEGRISGTRPEDTIHRRNKKLRNILKWLWDTAVRPVLHNLGLLSSKPPGKLPRIWWVTSGLMGSAPLHAAGYGWDKGAENTAGHVVSSYIPTFKALEYARAQSRKAPAWPNQRFLNVRMPNTTGWPDLDVSMDVPQEIIKAFDFEVLETPSKDKVLLELQGSAIVHFACHGQSDLSDPSSSRLYLADRGGSPEHLTVRDLLTTSLEMAQLAYLSACSTAENTSQHLRDEVIHIASAFLLVGFPHVIGSFWEANDDAAKNLSQIFYKELAGKMEQQTLDKQEKFAYAVHDAVTALRMGRVGGSRRKLNASDNVIAWAPFIHLGC